MNPLLPAPECSIYYPELDKNSATIINPKRNAQKAFTLIELSIVLVVIGLLAGGVLVGLDLIKAAEIRSQISQIEQYNRATNTFRGKYNNYLPGDIPEPDATRFGFAARGPYAGEGDGNGQLEGNWGHGPLYHNGGIQSRGENAVFWVDLTQAKLIPESFSLGSSTTAYATITPTSSPNLKAFFPEGKLGSSNYVYVYSDTFWTGTEYTSGGDNWFGISAVTSMPPGTIPYSGPGITAGQASAIDKKIDDGFPQLGKVLAKYLDYANIAGTDKASWMGATSTAATAASSSTCYDNGNVTGATQQYSVTQNNGNGVNCVLSFKFQ